MILPHPSGSHDPNKQLWFLWSPAGHKNNPSDLPHWSQNDFVSRDEYSPTVGSGGRAEARCWKRLVSLLLTLTLTRLWLVLGKIWEKTRLRLHNNSQSWYSLATYSMWGKRWVWWYSVFISLSTNPLKRREPTVKLPKPDIAYFSVPQSSSVVQKLISELHFSFCRLYEIWT